MTREELEKQKNLKDRLRSGELMEQRCWSFIKELNSCSEERLNSIALRDGFRQYTYRQMFRYWERYAEAFSAVGITGKNHSRAALIATPLTETIFAFYGLNMTGASVSLIYHFDLYDDKGIRNMIEKEGITDIIVSELYAFPKLMKRLLRDREMLGLRNIIVLGSPMGGEYAIPGLEMLRKLNGAMFRELDGGLMMEDLLRDHETYPISYGSINSDDASVILHTTGTVSGIHKPVPMSDKAMNAFVVCALQAKDEYEDFKKAPKKMISCLTLNMSWVYAMVDMLHTSLGLGMEVITLPIGGSNPRYAEAIEKYGINILFTSKAILDSWNKTMPDIDLSKLKVVFMGGSYVSPEFKKTFNDYLRSCGSSAKIINGYGLSELGGACIISPSSREDDAIGYPMPGFKVKIYVEDEGRFYDLEDGERTGVLYISSPTMSSGRLGDTVFFELEEIDGDLYFNSNDLIRVNADGSMTCIGRSNQYFVNNEGIRFDAGLIETALTAQPGIVACGLTPEFHKTLHDNVPVLYVETNNRANELAIVHKALVQVFINDDMLADSNMPSQCVFTAKVPLNSGGKVDGKKLASGTVTGKRFSIKPVKLNGRIADILLVPAAEGEAATMGAGIPEELEDDPYNILSEIFAAIPDINAGRFSKVFKIPGLREMILKLTDFDIRNIPESLGKVAPRLMKLTIDQSPIPFTKGENKVSDMMKGFFPMFREKKDSKPFMPFFPPVLPVMPPVPPMLPVPGMFPWGWSGRRDKKESERDGHKEQRETFMEQVQEMQKSSRESTKEQWGQFFSKFLEMQENFIAMLPDGEGSMFGAISPKAFMEKVKEFQEMANDHAVEQADAVFDLYMNGQKQIRDMISETMESGEEESAAAVVEEKDVVKPAGKAAPARKKSTGTAKAKSAGTAKKKSAGTAKEKNTGTARAKNTSATRTRKAAAKVKSDVEEKKDAIADEVRADEAAVIAVETPVNNTGDTTGADNM